jgi:S1-C subfamily serine protease
MKKFKRSLLKLAAVTAGLLVIANSCGTKSESWLRSRVVKLSSAKGMCSGEQVRATSGVDYILTAGHCRAMEVDGKITVTDAEGNKIQRKIVAEDPNSDLLLLEGLPNMKGLDIANSDQLTEHVRTFTHGANMATHKTEGEIIQAKQVDIPLKLLQNEEEIKECESMPKYSVLEIQSFFGPLTVCAMEVFETASSATIVPGSSGGMLVNDDGQLVGIASCTDGQFGYFVTLHDIQKFLSGY